jgi:hypothetical protein
MNRTSSTSSVTARMTWRLAHRPACLIGGKWGLLDWMAHAVHLPAFVMRPICDRYDIAVGITKEELIFMDYTRNGRKVPWWLR